MTSYVVHVPVGCDVSAFVEGAISMKNMKKRRVDINHLDDGVSVDVGKHGATVVSVRDYVYTKHRGDAEHITRHEVSPLLTIIR